MTGPGDLRLTAAGIVAAATGAPTEAPTIGEVAFVGGRGAVVLRGLPAAFVAELRRGARVEVRLVGEADGSAGSLTEAGKASGWGT